MRPLNKNLFGAGPSKLAIIFYNGSTIVKGIVVRQTGANRFVVTHGLVTKTIYLTENTSEAQLLYERYSTTNDYTSVTNKGLITCTSNGVIHFVKKIQSYRILTVEGQVLVWGLDRALLSTHGRDHTDLNNTSTIIFGGEWHDTGTWDDSSILDFSV